MRTYFLSKSTQWATPEALYAELHREFHFTLDPCPLDAEFKIDGLYRSWEGERVFCNPPYGRGVDMWLDMASQAEVAVYLLPARTDTKWFHDYCLGKATEIRFIKGRLRFGGSKENAPFPSIVVIFKGEN